MHKDQARNLSSKEADACISLAKLRARLSDHVDYLESKRDSAKAAAAYYPSTAQRTLGEADAYDDAAEDVREILAAWMK